MAGSLIAQEFRVNLDFRYFWQLRNLMARCLRLCLNFDQPEASGDTGILE